MNKRKTTSKKSSGRIFRIELLIMLVVLNIILITILMLKLNTMNQHIDKLNSILGAEGPVQDSAISNPKNTESGSPAENNNLTEALSSTVIHLSDETIAPDSYAQKCMLDNVAAPIERSEREIHNRLKTLGEANSDILKVYNNKEFYPPKMLENLANNPEMASYVKNYTGQTKKASAGFTDSEINEKYPLFLQWDERWGYVEYGDDSVIGLAGCGPTCLSMILFSLTRDESLTPDVLGKYAMENGYYMFGTGTMWALFEEVPALYGVTSENLDKKDDALVLQALKDGKMLVFSVGPGDFTAYGHFIVVYGIDDNGLLMVNDPNCAYRSTVHWDYKKIKNQIKNVWSFEYNENSLN